MSADPNDPVVLASVPSEVEASIIATALQEADIEAEVTDAASSQFRIGSPEGAHVLVKLADLERAKIELEKIRLEAAHIDWSKVEVGDPDPSE